MKRSVLIMAMLAPVLVLVLALLACGEKEDPDEAKDLYRRAVDLHGAGRAEEAEALYRRVKEEFPEARVAAKAEEQVKFIENMREVARRGRSRRAVDHLKDLARACERHRAEKGEYPETLDALVPAYIAEIPACVWGYAYNYRTESGGDGKTRQKCVLACFGSDGIPGGQEDAFDLIIKDGEFVQIHEWLR